jgi:long-chain fatty acid adenylyltransferase FadD28
VEEQKGNAMPMIESSIPAALRERAKLQPHATAFTFMNYDVDWAGSPERLTWLQLYRRACSIAQEMTRCASVGDRAVILTPQGLDYVAAFVGALQAGLIPVPLTDPQMTAYDAHIHSVMRDSSPSVILTTSLFASDVAEYAQPRDGQSAPSVIEVDRLNLNSAKAFEIEGDGYPSTAYLQYTSGSTRQPAAVMVSHNNLLANYRQIEAAYFEDYGGVAPGDMTVVSWVPLYHNMGLFIGVCAPILAGLHSVLLSPSSFVQRPARWMRLLAGNSRSFTPAPNFAFDLTAQATSDEDMAGLDLGDVLAIVCGGERIHTAALARFTERFARFNLRDTAMRPSYGLAEATVYVATRESGHAPKTVRFESEKLSAGHAERCRSGGTSLLSYGVPRAPTVRIVDPETRTESPAGTIGEIWVHGDNVAMGYWQRPDDTERVFAAELVAPSASTPERPWLRTGDVGVISEGELFIVGRIKDLVIVYGRNHYPDDIEATIQQITGGRAAAIGVPGDRTEQLVAIIEFDKRGESEPDAKQRLESVKRDVTSAISDLHGLGVADLVPVPPGSLPSTASGKVRRSACVERYQRGEFTRLDV